MDPRTVFLRHQSLIFLPRSTMYVLIYAIMYLYNMKSFFKFMYVSFLWHLFFYDHIVYFENVFSCLYNKSISTSYILLVPLPDLVTRLTQSPMTTVLCILLYIPGWKPVTGAVSVHIFLA